MQRKCATPQQKEKLQKKKKEDDKNLLNNKLQKKPIFESNWQPPDGEKKIRRKCANVKKMRRNYKQNLPIILHRLLRLRSKAG